MRRPASGALDSVFAARGFMPEAASVAAARAFVVETLSGRSVDARTVGVAEQLASELVTNAVVHAGTLIEVGIALDDSAVRIWVIDERTRFPMEIRAYDDGIRFGLGIVDALATEWGSYATKETKTVWFELERRGSRGRAAGT